MGLTHVLCLGTCRPVPLCLCALSAAMSLCDLGKASREGREAWVSGEHAGARGCEMACPRGGDICLREGHEGAETCLLYTSDAADDWLVV